MTARQRTMEAGFDHHLIKPVDFDELRQLAAGRLGKGQDQGQGQDSSQAG